MRIFINVQSEFSVHDTTKKTLMDIYYKTMNQSEMSALPATCVFGTTPAK